MSQKAARSWVALPLALYFLYFAKGALRARFAADDPMNLGMYWLRGLARSAGDVVVFWRPSYRPMGALFYLPLYHFFGLNPLPYRIAALAIIAANIFLTFRIGLRITRSLAGATLAAMIVCAHGAMTPIYYNTSQIYDVLAFFFTALALELYLRARERGGPNVAEGVVIALAYLAALNSKEIAVAGAMWVLACELLLEKRPWKLLVPATLIALAVVFTLTRALGPHSLSTMSGYRLEFTPHQFFFNTKAYLNDIFFTTWFHKSALLIGSWAAGTAVCAMGRRRELWCTWTMVSTALVPVLFTAYLRGGPSLYVPLLAFALWLETVATIFFKPWPIRQWSAAALAALLMIPSTLKLWDKQADHLLEEQQPTWRAIGEVRDLRARPAPHSVIVFLNNPFPGWDMWFIAMLEWNDPTLNVMLANKLGAAPDLATFDWVLAFEGDKVRLVQSTRPK